MDMLYMAVYPNRAGSIYRAEFFEEANNRLSELLPDEAHWSNVVRVIDGQSSLGLHMDTLRQKGICFIKESDVVED
jgi:hypothetical protein